VTKLNIFGLKQLNLAFKVPLFGFQRKKNLFSRILQTIRRLKLKLDKFLLLFYRQIGTNIKNIYVRFDFLTNSVYLLFKTSKDKIFLPEKNRIQPSSGFWTSKILIFNFKSEV